MLNEVTSAKLKALFEDKEFGAKFREIEDFAEMKKLFADNGVEISDEDLKKGLEIVLKNAENQNTDELTEEQMEEVSGGFVGWIIFGGACAVVSGVSAYKLRKALNSATGSCR